MKDFAIVYLYATGIMVMAAYTSAKNTEPLWLAFLMIVLWPLTTPLVIAYLILWCVSPAFRAYARTL